MNVLSSQGLIFTANQTNVQSCIVSIAYYINNLSVSFQNKEFVSLIINWEILYCNKNKKV